MFDGVTVSLDLDFLNPIISDIQSVTEPLQPIVNVLNAQVPGLNLLGIHETLIDLLPRHHRRNERDRPRQ